MIDDKVKSRFPKLTIAENLILYCMEEAGTHHMTADEVFKWLKGEGVLTNWEGFANTMNWLITEKYIDRYVNASGGPGREKIVYKSLVITG